MITAVELEYLLRRNSKVTWSCMFSLKTSLEGHLVCLHVYLCSIYLIFFYVFAIQVFDGFLCFGIL